MSRPTLPPPPAGFSPEEIAAQVAVFEARGGKIQRPTAGAQVMPHTLDMHAQHNLSMRVKIDGEAKKATKGQT